LAQPVGRSWIFRVLHGSEITRTRGWSNAWCGPAVNAQISPMTLLNAAATGAMGLLAGMSLAQNAPDHAPTGRSPLRGAAGLAAAAPAIGAALAGWRSTAAPALAPSAACAARD